MAKRGPTVGNRMARPAGPMPPTVAVPKPPTVAALTPKEVLGILRRHILLIIILTALGLGAGGGTWYLLRKYLPKYTAQTFVKVLPPVETDPMDIVAAQVQKDIHYQHRLSMANLIKQQRALQELLRNDKVRRTRWFERRNRDDRKAFKYLKSHLGAYAHRDAEFVEMSMTCRGAEEAALIVNEMAQWFVASQQDTTKTEVGERS